MLVCFGIFIFLIVTNNVPVLCGTYDSIQPYTVGGADASPGEFPYQISLQINYRHICGGSILNSKWILTAAHCFRLTSNPSNYTVLAGTTTLNFGGVRVKVAKIKTHQNYQPPITNDIAVVKLTSNLTWSSYIKPVKLSRVSTDAYISVTVTGWGYINGRSQEETNTLQKISVLTIANEDCANFLQRQIPAGDICTFSEAGRGVCQGDSGGPLVESSTNAQVGVVSQNARCASGEPEIYTRISSYLAWIYINQT